MRSALRASAAALVLGLLPFGGSPAFADTPVSTAVYRPAAPAVSVTPVRGYRYGSYYRPYVRGYYGAYRPYTAYRPYGYGAYYRGYPYGAYRSYGYPYWAARPYYGRYGYGPVPYYGGYYTYGRPGFTFGFGW